MRGFLGGVSVGALVAFGGAAMVSLSVPLPKAVDVSAGNGPQETAALEGTADPQAQPSRDADLVEAAPTEPSAEAENSPDQPAVFDTTPDARPEIDTDSTALAGAGAPAALPLLESTSDTDVIQPNTEALATPSAPSAEAAPVANTESATPIPVPATTNETDTAPTPTLGSATAPVAPDTPEPTTEARPEIAPLPQVNAPETTGLDAGDTASTAAPRVVDLTPEAGSVDQPEDIASLLPNPDASPANSDTAEAPRIANLPQVGADAGASDTTTEAAKPSIGTPATSLITTNPPADAALDQDSFDTLLPPFEANSAPAKFIEDQPYMSIVLIEGPGSVGAEALTEFPYPLTFAIDPAIPDAAERMAARRAAGFEVMLLADLPRDASAKDAETALAVWLDMLPQSMGILEGVDTGVQGNRPLADHVAALARDLGYGLVLQDKGLNTVQKLAKREGVPSGVVFRDFDGAGQDPRAIRRFLDQAAFRANQEGAVIMMGRLTPDTISALLMWGLQDRASRVALMPTSASLRLLLTK